ncbi:MAG: putative CRISPR-associated protein [Candidatus Schekmanbacteria bacterium]|nr:putative CRISPR-associated protein [Candidatus Schekmanbacteria bacterium]
MRSTWFVLSPCGTSLLNNACTGDEERRAVTDNTNVKERDQVSPAARTVLDTLIERVGSKLRGADRAQAARMSAELNGITALYREAGAGDSRPDMHQLLATDTWLGETTAQLVAEWLRGEGFTVDLRRQTDLRTVELSEFQAALSDVVRWAEETLPGYRQEKYHVIFNLTGGFKSVQGFLQTLATFYADEAVYIFETGSLLRIPRLPVKMAGESTVMEHLVAFRRLSSRLEVAARETESIPETLLMKLDGGICLSEWGELVWRQTSRALYEQKVWPSPSDRLRYGERFRKSVEGLSGERFRLVNERIDQLAKCLESGGTYNPQSLDLKPLRGDPAPPSTHEADAWADQDAKRLFGHYVGEAFVLDKLDRPLHH